MQAAVNHLLLTISKPHFGGDKAGLLVRFLHEVPYPAVASARVWTSLRRGGFGGAAGRRCYCYGGAIPRARMFSATISALKEKTWGSDGSTVTFIQ
jgi:hypothetical protein